MIRAASEVRQRCYNHPHRRATRQCARCKRGMCDQCARERGEGQLCELCQSEVDERERIEHPPIEERVRRAGNSLRNLLVGGAIVGLLAVPGYFVVKNLMSTPITPEEFARFRYAAAGSFDTPEGVNTLSTVLGGKVLSASSVQEGFPERRLIDEYVGPGFPGWRSADETVPQEVVFETAQPTRIEKVILTQQPTEPPETFVREFEVLVAAASPEGPWRTIGRWTLDQSLDPQRFVFDAAETRYIKLRVLSTYGGPYASLGEFDAYVLPRGPFDRATPEARPTP
jgi:hypothetical protein